MSGDAVRIDTNRNGWDKAEVFRPDGKVETLTNLAADHFYSVREGAGVVSSMEPATAKPKQP